MPRPPPKVLQAGEISLHCGAPGNALSVRSDGARLTKGWRATRRRTSTQKLRRESQTPGGNGGITRSGQRYLRCHRNDPSQIFSGIFRRRSGWKHDDGQGAGAPRRNTRCRIAKSRTVRLPSAPKGSPRDTISRRQGMPAPDSTFTGLRFALLPSAGGASAARKRETTSSR